MEKFTQCQEKARSSCQLTGTDSFKLGEVHPAPHHWAGDICQVSPLLYTLEFNILNFLKKI